MCVTSRRLRRLIYLDDYYSFNSSSRISQLILLHSHPTMTASFLLHFTFIFSSVFSVHALTATAQVGSPKLQLYLQGTQHVSPHSRYYTNFKRTRSRSSSHLSSSNQQPQDNIPRIQASSLNPTPIFTPDSSSSSSNEPSTPAAQTNTINTRLLAEIEAATRAEGGPKTKLASKMSQVFSYSPSKTPEERQRALDQARDLNGISPMTTLTAGVVACIMGYGLWMATQSLAVVFFTHPVSVDAPYMFARLASVFRNVVMGITSLASGFFFVTGLGIFLLGVRVTQGVVSGELDPEKKNRSSREEETIELPNIWDLMLGKKKRRG